eukprot:2631940-Ditylum_brightwellii.AAC.1
MSVAISVGLYLFLVAHGFYLLECSDCKDVLLVSSQQPIHGMPVEDSMEGLEQDDQWKAQDMGRRHAEENTVKENSDINDKRIQRYTFAHIEDTSHNMKQTYLMEEQHL